MGKLLWLTKREKIMLGILGGITVILLFYFFVFLPKLNEITALAEEEAQLALTVEEADRGITQLPQLGDGVKALDDKLAEMEQAYFLSIVQERTILLLNNLLNEASVTDRIINFSEITTEPLGEEFPEHYRHSMDVSIRYEATYDAIMKFIKSIENYEKFILIKNIELSLETAGADPKISGTIALFFQSQPPFDLSDVTEEDWDFHNPYGRTNPFVAFTGYSLAVESAPDIPAATSSNTAANAPKNAQNAVLDFFVSVKPQASDMPSIMVGFEQDATGQSHIQEDSNQVENVAFAFVRSNNGYGVSYKTAHHEYPAGGGAAAFKPRGDMISIGVISRGRISASDLSGLRLSITNATDKKVQVMVINDDKQAPRVAVSGQNNTYEVINQ